MKVVYTDQCMKSLEELLSFLIEKQGILSEKVAIIRDLLFNRADSIALNPDQGQREEYLRHLKEDHRRIIEGHIKIIYKVENNTVFIVDFFDSRQLPSKMRG